MIKTSRLMLYKPKTVDQDVISDILSSPKQTKYLPNEAPYSQRQQKEYLSNRVAHWKDHGFGTFIIALKDRPSIKMGFVGAEFAPNPGYVDIRFGIISDFEGKGFVTEAASACVTWFFDNTEHKKLYGVSMAENEGSKAVLKKIGMKPEKGVNLYNCEGLESFSVETPRA